MFLPLGDDDLLEIIGQSKNPQSIQNHLKKLFAGISSVVFDEKKTSIVAIASSEREIVTLKVPVLLSDKIEEWLSNLVVEMKSTLKAILVDCLKSGVNDLIKYPQQIGRYLIVYHIIKCSLLIIYLL